MAGLHTKRKSATVANPEDRSWILALHGEDCAVPIQLDAANMLAQFPDGWVPSGVEVSKVVSGLYQLGQPVGSTKPLLLHYGVDVNAGENVPCAGLWHAVVNEAKVNAIAGVAGNGPVDPADHPGIYFA